MGRSGRGLLFALLAFCILLITGLLLAALGGEAYCRISRRCAIEQSFSVGGGACRQKQSRLLGPGALNIFPVGCKAIRNEYFAGNLLSRSEILWESRPYGQRFVPYGRGDDEASGALFFGCSFTFGLGVNDEESMPSVFARAMEGMEVRNFAESGTGPASTLVALRDGTPGLNAFPLRGSRNYAFYGLLGSHVLRVRSSRWASCGWVGRLPRFGYDAAGKLQQEGVLYGNCPLPRAPLEWLLNHSQLFQYFNIYGFQTPTETDLKLTAEVILAARDAFRARFGSENFFVVAYPSPDLPAWTDGIMGRLRAGGITVFDYSRLVDFEQPQFHIPRDNHPSALTHRLVGEALARDFKAYLNGRP